MQVVCTLFTVVVGLSSSSSKPSPPYRLVATILGRFLCITVPTGLVPSFSFFKISTEVPPLAATFHVILVSLIALKQITKCSNTASAYNGLCGQSKCHQPELSLRNIERIIREI